MAPKTTAGTAMPDTSGKKGHATPTRVSRTSAKGSNPISRANASAKQTSSPNGFLPPKWQHRVNVTVNFTFGWFVALAVALIHITAFAAATRFGTAPALLVLVVPAVVTFWRVPTSRPKSLRWLVVWVVANAAVSAVQLPMLLLGEAWALRQFWSVERPAVERHQRGKAIVGWYAKHLSKLNPSVSARYAARQAATQESSRGAK